MANIVGYHTTTSFILLHNRNYKQHLCYFSTRRRPLCQLTAIQILSPPLHLCRSRRLWDSNAESYTSNNDSDDDFDQAREAFDDFIDSMWILKVFRSYGWMLPPILISMLIVSGPKAFFTALALPIGQSTFTFAFRRMQSESKKKQKLRTKKNKKKRRPPSYSSRNIESEEEAEWVNSFETRIKKKEYQSWILDNDVVSDSSFGGWDDLDSGMMESNARSTEIPDKKSSVFKGRTVKKSKLYREISETSTPILLRILISIFPFLEFME